MSSRRLKRKPISKSSIPPTLVQEFTIKDLCKKMNIPEPYVKSQQEASFVLDDLWHSFDEGEYGE